MGILAGGGNASTASTKPETRQQQSQLGKCLYRRPWFPQIHGCTCRGAEHPGWHDDDDARGGFNVHDLTAGTLFAVLSSDALPIQRVPSVEDFDFLRDMRRMTQ